MTPVLVNATGAARRLQALAVAGYGTRQLAEILGAQRRHVKWWQQHYHRQVYLCTHQRVDYTYWRLIDEDGPSTLARNYAVARGWLPFDAWTALTIDDPEASAFSDPAQFDHLDEVLLARVRIGRARYVDLTYAEKRYMLTQHLRAGGSLRRFRDLYRPVPKKEMERLIAETPDLLRLVAA